MDTIKIEKLKNYICSLGSVAVSFSAGVDSTLLLKIAHDVLGDKAIAITASSPSFPSAELDEAKRFCKENGIKHIVVEFDQLGVDGFCQNTSERCYICKKALFTRLVQIAHNEGIESILEGSNLDDDDDFRPGMRAIKELGILSPLRTSQLTKNEIRQYSKQLGLKTFSKPAMACLSTRIAQNEQITLQKLEIIEKAEDFLRTLNLAQVRARLEHNSVRIEVLPQDMAKIVENAEQISQHIKGLGASFVSLDLGGYKQGNMNLQEKK